MGTETVTYGSTRREGHDSSGFYARFDAPKTSADETIQTVGDVDRLYAKSSEDMSELPDNSVALMVTSPPYHVGKDYDTEDSFDEYLDLLWTVMEETYRVLEPGGRAAINVAGLGRKPYIPLPTYLDAIMLELGYFPRGVVVWEKAKGASGSCAWGSFQSAKNPVLRDVHEFIHMYSKGRFDRPMKGKSTISKEEFMEFTLSIWSMAPARAKSVGHPAPFPEELPRRCIELYTYENDVILDPFIGAGATAIAAKRANRHYIGYDNSDEYITLAEKRIAEAGF